MTSHHTLHVRVNAHRPDELLQGVQHVPSGLLVPGPQAGHHQVHVIKGEGVVVQVGLGHFLYRLPLIGYIHTCKIWSNDGHSYNVITWGERNDKGMIIQVRLGHFLYRLPLIGYIHTCKIWSNDGHSYNVITWGERNDKRYDHPGETGALLVSPSIDWQYGATMVTIITLSHGENETTKV